ncbi:MAG: hypothetical protein WCA35_14095 [Kovacikia sp.]
MLRFLFAFYLVLLVFSGFNWRYSRLKDFKGLFPGAAIVAVMMWLLKDV